MGDIAFVFETKEEERQSGDSVDSLCNNNMQLKAGS